MFTVGYVDIFWKQYIIKNVLKFSFEYIQIISEVIYLSFKAEKEKIYTAPAIYGTEPCMLQNDEDQRYEGVQASVRQYNVAYEVDRAALEEILVEGMELISPTLVLRFEALDNVAWLAGRSMDRVELLVPVKMNGKAGLYNMVIWENNGDSIVAGRNILGHAKVFAHINEEKNDGKHTFKARSWDFEFLKAEFACADEAVNELPEYLKQPEGTFHYKYLPRTGEGFVNSDADYVLFAENKEEVAYKSCKAEFKWNTAAFEDAPTQYTYINQIEALTPKNIVGAYYAEFDRTDDGYDQIKID